MNNDIYLIILTAFAMLGIYSFIIVIFDLFDLKKLPPSVTIIKNNHDDKTFKKVKYVEENIPNNHTLLYPFDDDKNGEESAEILNRYLTEILNVNN